MKPSKHTYLALLLLSLALFIADHRLVAKDTVEELRHQIKSTFDLFYHPIQETSLFFQDLYKVLISHRDVIQENKQLHHTIQKQKDHIHYLQNQNETFQKLIAWSPGIQFVCTGAVEYDKTNHVIHVNNFYTEPEPLNQETPYLKAQYLMDDTLWKMQTNVIVLNPKGLVGIVDTQNTNQILPITNERIGHIPVYVTYQNIEQHFILETQSTGMLVGVFFQDESQNIHLGAKVFTSGKGGRFPPGVSVGTVVENPTPFQGLQTIVQPDVDFENLTLFSLFIYESNHVLISKT